MAGIFDKVVVGLNKGVNTVSEGSKSLIEKAKINTQIQDCEQKKSNLFQTMGTLVYNLQSQNEIHIGQCEKICDEITSINTYLSELQRQLQTFEMPHGYDDSYFDSDSMVEKGGIVCDSCGFMNKSVARFCAKCGKKINKEL